MEKQQSNQEKRAQFEAGKPFEITNQRYGKLNKYRLFTHSYDSGEILWIEKFSSLGRWEHHCEFDSVSDDHFVGWDLILGTLHNVTVAFENIEFENEPEAAQE